MLPKQNRLTKKQDFQKVLSQGKIVQGRLFGLAMLGSKDNGLKIGIIVSKKISKRAVERNRIKRIWRKAILQDFSKITKGMWLVFLAKGELAGKEKEDILSEVKRMLSRSGLSIP